MLNKIHYLVKSSSALFAFLFVTTSFCAIQEDSINLKTTSSLSRGPEWNCVQAHISGKGPAFD